MQFWASRGGDGTIHDESWSLCAEGTLCVGEEVICRTGRIEFYSVMMAIIVLLSATAIGWSLNSDLSGRNLGILAALRCPGSLRFRLARLHVVCPIFAPVMSGVREFAGIVRSTLRLWPGEILARPAG